MGEVVIRVLNMLRRDFIAPYPVKKKGLLSQQLWWDNVACPVGETPFPKCLNYMNEEGGV
jgi:hypothetical protein